MPAGLPIFSMTADPLAPTGGSVWGLILALMILVVTTSINTFGHASPRPNTAAAAHALIARFRAIDWDVRAAMSKQPTKDDTAWQTRLEVENKLATLGPAAVPILLHSMNDPNRHVRALAAYVLGVRAEVQAAEGLRHAVTGDKDATVRLYAAEALGRIGDIKSRPALEDVAKSDANPNVRYAAEQALLRLTSISRTKNHLLALARAFDPHRMALAVVGKPAPDFQSETEEGKEIKLSDFQSKKPVILLFQLADW